MRFLVVGLGSMGRRRVRNLRALGLTDIVGFDLRADRRSQAVADYGIQEAASWDAARACGAYAWIVSTPPLSHLAIAREALDRGAHVFTEADLPDPEVKEVMRRRDQTGLIAVPSCTMLYYPGPKKVRDVVLAEEIGKPLLFTYQSGQYLPDWHPWERYQDFYVSRRETGAAREIVPFELVWLTRLFGDVAQVKAIKGRSGNLDADIDDYYALTLSFASGVAGTMLVDVVARPEVRVFRVNGTLGTLEWDQLAKRVQWRRFDQTDWTVHALETGSVEANYINPEEPYIGEISDFLAAIEGRRAFPFRYEDELALHAVLERAEDEQVRAVA